MKPIEVSTTAKQPREEVFDFLDVMANHEPFTNHMLVDWTFSGPERGVGAKARLRANLPGPKDWADMEVVDGERPRTIVEQSVSAGGKRRTQGTYTLEDLPGGGTLIRFELRFLQTPLPDRILGPLLRGWLVRANAKAMDRLSETLAARA